MAQHGGPFSDDVAEAFLYHVTHDLRGYVRALRMIPDWIDEDLSAAGLSLPDAIGEHLALQRDYALALDRTLSALTELSRVGRLAEPSTDLPLWPLLREIWATLPGTQHFRLELAGEGPVLHGPRNDLVRAFGALLRNAIDHHHATRGRVHVSARTQNARLMLRIEDDGPGVPPDDRETIFKPLQGLRPRSQTGRAGLGLTVARKVVQSLSGRIWATDPRELSGFAIALDLPAAGSGHAPQANPLRPAPPPG